MRFWLGHKPRKKDGATTPPKRAITLTPIRKVEDLPDWAWSTLDDICEWPTAAYNTYPLVEFVGGWS